MTKYVVALENQNVFDIVTQEYGSLEALFDFILANGITGLEANLIAGKRYKLPLSSNTNKPVQDYYQKNSLKVCTGKNKIRRSEENGIRITELDTIRIDE